MLLVIIFTVLVLNFFGFSTFVLSCFVSIFLFLHLLIKLNTDIINDTDIPTTIKVVIKYNVDSHHGVILIILVLTVIPFIAALWSWVYKTLWHASLNANITVGLSLLSLSILSEPLDIQTSFPATKPSATAHLSSIWGVVGAPEHASVSTIPINPHSFLKISVNKPWCLPVHVQPILLKDDIKPFIFPSLTPISKTFKYISLALCSLKKVATPYLFVSWSLKAKCLEQTIIPFSLIPLTWLASIFPPKTPSSE